MNNNITNAIVAALIFIGALVVILTIRAETKYIEELNSFNENADYIVNYDINFITSDAASLTCNVQYFHNESRPGMITPTVDLINSCLKHEITSLAREYSMADFINKRDEIINRIRAIPQQSENKISSDFSWEIITILIKL